MNLRIRGILLSTCILPALWANGQAIRIKSAMLKTGAPTGGYHNGYSGFIDLRYQIENNIGDTLAFIPYYNNVIMEGYTMPLMLIQSQQKTLNKRSAITDTVWICRKKLQDIPYLPVL